MGILVYLVLSRFAHGIPYTATMFVVGLTFGALWTQVKGEDKLFFSVGQWIYINGEVILLSFLPGLLYLDSYLIDTHVFFKALPQLLTFAFPMVLGGTALTALVLKFVILGPLFPWEVSFDFCMMTGAVLAATDPVAVAVLLNELGAPPRLKVRAPSPRTLDSGCTATSISDG